MLWYTNIKAKETTTREEPTMERIYKNEIMVAERDDMSYTVDSYAGMFYAYVHFRPENPMRRWEFFKVGNKKGYKTERGALNAIKRHAKSCGRFDWAPSGGATLVF